MLTNPVKVAIVLIIIAIAIVVVKYMGSKKNNNLKSRKNRMMRQPLLVRNGRVVSPTMMNSRNHMAEGFSQTNIHSNSY